MGLFEDTIREGLENPACKLGWDEAEEELRSYYASLTKYTVVEAHPSVTSYASYSNGVISYTIAEQKQYTPPVVYSRTESSSDQLLVAS